MWWLRDDDSWRPGMTVSVALAPGIRPLRVEGLSQGQQIYIKDSKGEYQIAFGLGTDEWLLKVQHFDGYCP